MLRVKVTLSYLVLVTALVGIVVLLVSSTVGTMTREQTEASLRRAAVAAEQSARLDQAALLAKANFLSDGDRLYRSLKGEFVQEPEEGADAAPADFAGQRHLDAHEKLTAQKYKLDEIAKEQADARDMSRDLLARGPKDLDMFLVVDDKGIGVAALGKDLYSWFGRDLAKDHPSVMDVAKGGNARIEYWMWAFKPGQEQRLYQVALSPIRRSENEEPSGVLVLGLNVNDGVATKKQALIVGAEEGAEPAGPEVAFYRGQTLQGSTFSADRQAAVAEALGTAGLLEDDPFSIGEVTLDEVPYLAMSRQLAAGENSVGVVVVSSLEAARGPLASLRVDMVLVGVVFLIFGALLIVFLVVRYIKPVEELETGIQEVIAGNKDYHWDQRDGHELQASLAQGLNLMSAYLQGKPMPDDDSAGGGWGDLMPSAGDQTANQGGGQVQGVDLASLSAPPPKSDGEGDA